MGIRYMAMAYLNGKNKLAQYGNSGGSFEEAGRFILSFIKEMFDNADSLECFKENLSKCTFVKNETINHYADAYMSEDPTSDAPLIKFYRDYPQYDISTGYGILEMIKESPQALKDDSYRIADSIFTEYAYVLDFDTNTFEIYKGFNDVKLTKTDRFYSRDQDKSKDMFGGYPLRILCSFDMKNLPTEDGFLKQAYEAEEVWNET